MSCCKGCGAAPSASRSCDYCGRLEINTPTQKKKPRQITVANSNLTDQEIKEIALQCIEQLDYA